MMFQQPYGMMGGMGGMYPQYGNNMMYQQPGMMGGMMGGMYPQYGNQMMYQQPGMMGGMYGYGNNGMLCRDGTQENSADGVESRTTEGVSFAR